MRALFVIASLWLSNYQATAQSDFSAQVGKIVAVSKEKGFENPVIFIGSSSIRMWSSLEQDFPKSPILNHGFGGSEYSDLIKYQQELIEEFEPSMVVVYAGDNDIAKGEKPKVIAEEAEVFVDGLRRVANGAPVIVLSVKPSVTRWKYKKQYEELNALIRASVESMEHAVFVDVWQPMLTPKGEVNELLFVADGVHMNKKGYEIWVNALKPFLPNK